MMNVHIHTYIHIYIYTYIDYKCIHQCNAEEGEEGKTRRPDSRGQTRGGARCAAASPSNCPSILQGGWSSGVCSLSPCPWKNLAFTRDVIGCIALAPCFRPAGETGGLEWSSPVVVPFVYYAYMYLISCIQRLFTVLCNAGCVPHIGQLQRRKAPGLTKLVKP